MKLKSDLATEKPVHRQHSAHILTGGDLANCRALQD
jgi:hypothetical protein